MGRPRKVIASDTMADVWRLKAQSLNRETIVKLTGLSERQVRAILAGSQPATSGAEPRVSSHPVQAPEVLAIQERNVDRQRYPKRRISLGPRTFSADGKDLGYMIYPQDIMAAIKHAYDLSDIDVVDAMRLGADRVLNTSQDDPPAVTMGIVAARRERVAGDVLDNITNYRIKAWRKRYRHMTWDELRTFLLGLKDFELGDR